MPRTHLFWKSLHLLLGSVAVLLLLGPAISKAQFVVYTESFEYADQPALVAEWPRGIDGVPFGDCDPGCLWENELILDTGNASDGTRSAGFDGGQIDFNAPQVDVGGWAGLNANLGIGGAPVNKVSWDTLADSAQGYDGSVIFQMETIIGSSAGGPSEYYGSVFTNPGSLELQFASQNANVITPLGINLLDGEWNTIEVTIAANGIDRNFSVTNSGGTSVSGYTATDVSGNEIDQILMFDNIQVVPTPANFGGRIDNIIIESSSPPPTEFTWNNPASDTWNSPANWTLNSIGNAFPGTIEHKAIFGDAIGSDTRVVFSDQSNTLNSIELNNTMGGSYQIVGGPAGITLSDSAALTAPTVDVLSGSHELQVPLTLTGDTTITSGDDTTLTFHNIIDLGGNDLTINRASGGTENGLVILSTSIRGTGSVTNNATLGAIQSASLGGDLESSGTLDIDITPDAAGQLAVGGTATLEGSINVDFLDGATPTGAITLLTSDNPILLPNGLPALTVTGASGLALALSRDRQSLLLTAIPEPATLGLLVLVGLIGLASRRSHRGLVCSHAMIMLQGVVLLGVLPTAANAQIIYSESFEYADQAALEAQWPQPPEPGVTNFWSEPIKRSTFFSSDGATAVFTAGDNYSRNDDLGILGATVTKVSYDIRLDTGVGINGSSVFEMWEIGTVYAFDTLQGSILTPNFASGDYELHFLRPDAFPSNAQPLGISLADGDWNTVEMTVAANGDRTFSVTNSGGTFPSAVTNTDYDNPYINAIVIADQDPITGGGGGGASYVDNIVIEGTLTPATEFNWIGTASDSWNSFTNWTRNGTGDAPSSAEHTAIFGDSIGSSSRVVFTDSALTVNSIEFNNTQGGSYLIAGGPGITLEENAALSAPTVEVSEGSHEFQIPVNLSSNTTVTAGDDSTLTFTNTIALGTNNLTIDPETGGTDSGVVMLNGAITGTGNVTNNATLGTGLGTTVGGDLDSTGTLDFDITPNSAGQWTVGGTATLDGAINVDFLDGETPSGDITLLTSTGPIVLPGGGVGSLSLNVTGASGLSLALGGGGTSLLLTSGGDPADLNMDGFVDGLDLGILLGNWDQTTTPAMGELNNQPPVDGLDLGILLGSWNPSTLGAGEAVPEPSAWLLACLGVVGGLSLRRLTSQSESEMLKT